MVNDIVHIFDGNIYCFTFHLFKTSPQYLVIKLYTK